MNYEEMSDFEINKAVSKFVDFGDLAVTFNDGNEVVYLCDKDGFFDMIPISHFDPCNSPSSAWPIITESKIAILPNAQGTWLSYGWEKWNGKQDFSPRKEHIDKKPLRAAMICFLKMKDGENK